VKKLYPIIVQRFPDLEPYFPHYEKDYIPPGKFFWAVFSTLYPEVVKLIVSKSHEKRVSGEQNGEDEMVQMRDDIWELIKVAPFISSKPIDDS